MNRLRHVGIFIAIYVCVVAQTSVVADLPEIGRPFLPALMLVLIAAWSSSSVAIVWSGVVGLMLDGVSTERLGVQLGLATILALGLQLVRPAWRSKRALTLVALVLAVTLAWKTLSPMTQAVLSGRVVDPRPILGAALSDAIATAVVSMIFCLASILLMGRFEKKQLA